jgi:hypothetical protein
MAFQGMQFPELQQQPSFFERSTNQNILNNEEAQGQQDLYKSQAINFIKDLEAKNYQDEINSKLALQHAQALNQYNQAMGIGGHTGKGENQYAPHDYEKLETYHDKQVAKYGPESEQAKRAKLALKGWLSSHGENRFAPTQTTKYENELAAAEAKYGKNSQQYKNLELAQNKERSDEATRTSALAATNLQKTIKTMNIDDLVRYSGPAGQIQLGIEKAKALAGQASPEYLRYEQAVTSIKTEADELAKFLKTPAHKKAYNDIHELTNPTGWGTSPQVAKAKLEKLREIVDKTAKTFQEAQISTNQHLGTKGKEEAIKKVESTQQQYAPATEEDIQYSMQKNNMTREEVLKEIGE